ncbi:MAG: hypothetical protein IKJ80_05270 [Clostridia bacterium]|nr:hypothetical protein [Clostridia bacterium]
MLVSRIFDRAVSLIIRAKIAADTDSMVRATTAAASLAAKTTKVTETKTETRSETKTQSVSGSENETVTANETTSENNTESSTNNVSVTDSSTESVTDAGTKTVSADGTRSDSGTDNRSFTSSETTNGTNEQTKTDSSTTKLTETLTKVADNADELYISEVPTSAENVTTTMERLVTIVDEETSNTANTTYNNTEEIEGTTYDQTSITRNIADTKKLSVTTHDESEESATSTKSTEASGESTKTNTLEKTGSTTGENERNTTTSSSNESDTSAESGVEAEISTVKITETSGVELFPERSEAARKAYMDSIMEDYTERAPYIFAALVSEASRLDQLYRRAYGLPEQPPYDVMEISLDSEFPLCDRFVSAAVNYTAAMLILDDDVSLYERLFHRWCDALCVIGTEIPATLHGIVNKYPY